MVGRTTETEHGGSSVALAGGRWAIAVLLVVLICGGVLRLSDLDEIGLNGSDNTYYTNIARQWSEGDRVYAVGSDGVAYYRPFLFAVYGAAVHLLGFDDVSIKAVNGWLDTLNILLVFLLAFILSRREPWAAASAATIYALLPFTILVSRSELSHTLSTSTLLAAMILLAVCWDSRRRRLQLATAFLAGVSTGLCALTHEEMIFAAAAPSVLLLLAPSPSMGSARARLTAAVSRSGSYLFGVLVIANGMLRAHQTEAQDRAAEIMVNRISHSHYSPFFDRPLKYLWNALTATSSTVVTTLVIVLLILLVVGFVRRLGAGRLEARLPSLPVEDLPLWTVIGHIFVFSFFFTYYAARLFLPLTALVIVWLAVRVRGLTTRRLAPRTSLAVLAGLTVVAVAANIGRNATFVDSMASHFGTWTPYSLAADLRPVSGWEIFQRLRMRTGWARLRYNELGGAVADDARLLVGSSTLHPFPGRRPLQVGYYFGDNAVYLIDHREPIDRLIDDKDIAFVLFTTYQNESKERLLSWGGSRRYLYGGRWSAVEPVSLGRSLGLDATDYSVRSEFDLLRANMEERGARIILGRRDLLTRLPSGTDPVSFVVWALEPELWPPLKRELEATADAVRLSSLNRWSEALAVLEAADTPDLHATGRFRLKLNAALVLAENGRLESARESVIEAMEILPRTTVVSTALNEAYPTAAASEEAFARFAGILTGEPSHHSQRDLLLSLGLNLCECSLKSGSTADIVAAFESLELELENRGTKKLTMAVAEWALDVSRQLSVEGRNEAARAAARAAAAGRRHFD